MTQSPSHASAPVPAHVAILMATYNGARDLPAQLESFAAQQHGDWSLLVGDDGSTDASRALIEAFAAAGHDVTLCDGPGQGAAENFMALIRRAGQTLPKDSWMAFSDQDDVWLPHRLSRGIAALSGLRADRPALYCTRTLITDAQLGARRLSVPRPRPLGFANALVQNVAAGNTILLNPAAAALVMAAATEAGRVVVHDWWVYQIISGAGGALVHDDTPTVLYRQHLGNEIGANDTLGARMNRLKRLAQGQFRRWNEINVAALRGSAARLTPENAALLGKFEEMRQAPFWHRLRLLHALGLYRQTRVSTIALWVSAALRLI